MHENCLETYVLLFVFQVLREALEHQKNQQDQLQYKRQLEEELASHEADVTEIGLTKDRLKVFFTLMDSNPALVTENTMFKDPNKPIKLTKKPEKTEGESDEALLERTDTFVTQIGAERLSNPDKSFYQDPLPEETNKRSESMEHFGTGLQLDIDDEAPEDLKDIMGLETSRTLPKVSKKKRKRNKSESTGFRSMDDVRGGVLNRVRESLKPKPTLADNPAYRSVKFGNFCCFVTGFFYHLLSKQIQNSYAALVKILFMVLKCSYVE